MDERRRKLQTDKGPIRVETVYHPERDGRSIKSDHSAIRVD